ncbi:hypothetical protein DM02DRAFT_660175 [Periconia macrospinosa]|uniref:FAD-binding FR-type domain-containing protein n=1 Tax=Periconia macrospinosa TaxID=97972 RepID=A0A2V1DBF9_9PLEO|nr:hypothetical protein DM02DRAFT_660175 [Periconia macrospinosa]
MGSGPPCNASLEQFNDEVVQVKVRLKRPINVESGQYVYLSIPDLKHHGIGIFQWHPYMVAWSFTNEETAQMTIVLLVQIRRGFTRDLGLVQRNVGKKSKKMNAIIDGPYGSSDLRIIGDYDKVLFMADGIGIAAHLLSIRSLLLAHNDRTARVRRMSLVWLLESKEQTKWGLDFLHRLHDLDTLQILNVYLLLPDEDEGASEGKATVFETGKDRIYPDTSKLDIDFWIREEWKAEAGEARCQALSKHLEGLSSQISMEKNQLAAAWYSAYQRSQVEIGQIKAALARNKVNWEYEHLRQRHVIASLERENKKLTAIVASRGESAPEPASEPMSESASVYDCATTLINMADREE